MRVLRTVAELREALGAERSGARRIGLVPTMGALHAGHLSLIRHAGEHCDAVVVSLFVNPAQFNETSDLERYPRSEREDSRLASEAGADILFAPSIEEVYPQGFSTAVEVLGVTERLEGASRGAEHFRGVATVVTKLLCMAQPDVAYFGQKDAQQLLVIRRLAADLNLAVQIEGLPTVRDVDGLALSSRNALLDASDRERAVALWEALSAAAELAAGGERSAAALITAARGALDERAIEAEYVALVDPDSFDDLTELRSDGLMAIAARVGGVRLIDNAILQPASAALASEELAACSG